MLIPTGKCSSHPSSKKVFASGRGHKRNPQVIKMQRETDREVFKLSRQIKKQFLHPKAGKHCSYLLSFFTYFNLVSCFLFVFCVLCIVSSVPYTRSFALLKDDIQCVIGDLFMGLLVFFPVTTSKKRAVMGLGLTGLNHSQRLSIGWGRQWVSWTDVPLEGSHLYRDAACIQDVH